MKSADEAAQGGSSAAKGADDGLSDGAKISDDVVEKFSSTETDEPISTVDSFSFPVTLVDTDITIRSGSYNYWKLNYSDLSDSDADHVNFEYEVVVRSGGPVDVILQAPTEFDYFSEGRRSKYYTEASSLGTTNATGQFELPLDNFVIVVDNSSRGVAESQGDVQVSVQITGTPEE